MFTERVQDKILSSFMSTNNKNTADANEQDRASVIQERLLLAQERVALLQEREYEEKRQEKETAEASKATYRRATAEAALATHREREAAQNRCPHMKPNFRPATAGQKDHSGVYHIFCQYCQKEFIGNQLPFHLQPTTEVGGPQ